jgi:hypothetical protein
MEKRKSKEKNLSEIKNYIKLIPNFLDSPTCTCHLHLSPEKPEKGA